MIGEIKGICVKISKALFITIAMLLLASGFPVVAYITSKALEIISPEASVSKIIAPGFTGFYVLLSITPIVFTAGVSAAILAVYTIHVIDKLRTKEDGMFLRKRIDVMVRTGKRM